MVTSFTSSQVSERTGLTARQLQWWDEQGIVVPAREGHRRLYSEKDMAELTVLCDLRRRGFSLQRIRRMLELLRREFGQRLAELAERGPEVHLLTDGESVFLSDSERGVVDLLRNARQPLLEICLGPDVRRVLGDAHEVPQAPEAAQAPKKSSQPARAAQAARATARH